MGRFFKRISFAIILSSACFFGTEYWYDQKTLTDVVVDTQKIPIAVLEHKLFEVQRKPIGRVIWEDVSKDAGLYAGEAIRTTNDAEATIRFIASGTTINLEPNSLVTIEENENGIALDFISGNLFVKNENKTNKGTSGLKLKSGTSEIDLNTADLSLSKNNEGQVDLQIFEGVANLTQDGQTQQLNNDASGTLSESGLTASANNIKIISPLPGRSVFIDPKTKLAKFTWQNLPKGYFVYFEYQQNSDSLSRMDKATSGNLGSIEIPFRKIGRVNWRLVAIPTDKTKPELKSKLMSAKIVAKTPPILIEPANKATVAARLSEPRILLKWSNPKNIKSLVAEVASDQNLSNIIYTESIQNSNINMLKINLKESGIYYWRLTGFLESDGEQVHVSSAIYSFIYQLGLELEPPVLKSPAPEQNISFQKAIQTGVYFSWQPLAGVERYQIEIRPETQSQDAESAKNSIVENITTSPFKITSLQPGRYTWFMRSFGDDDQLSGGSEVRSFVINDLIQLQWANNNSFETYFYLTPKASLRAEWMPISQISALEYRYRLRRESEPEFNDIWYKTTRTFLFKEISEDGSFVAEVEALDAQGRVVARSSQKKFSVQAKPILPQPIFKSEVPEVIQANKTGSMNVQWNHVNGAKEYVLRVLTPEGQTVREQRVNRTTASVEKLKPGDYRVSVTAVDEFERPGNESEQRPLSVPNTSGIQAPKLKGINIK